MLVLAAQRGDRTALDTLLRTHLPRVRAVCLRLTGNEADAADASQEALMAIVRALPRFDGRSSVGTWIYRIATNAALDELRRRRRRSAGSLDEHRDPADGRPHHEVADLRRDIGETLADRITIGHALSALSEDFRTAVVLRDVADLDYQEIAEVLEIPIGTVRSRIARGRAALADHLSGNQPTEPRRPSGQR